MKILSTKFNTHTVVISQLQSCEVVATNLQGCCDLEISLYGLCTCLPQNVCVLMHNVKSGLYHLQYFKHPINSRVQTS